MIIRRLSCYLVYIVIPYQQGVITIGRLVGTTSFTPDEYSKILECKNLIEDRQRGKNGYDLSFECRQGQHAKEGHLDAKEKKNSSMTLNYLEI
ncbi:unnamed protein product [Haemonchus placei]|uniref:Uncharacterized protein n=1 Tax=Haemonchus placei TaxID=6290 RepID=A0A0N4WHN8_HAEPC|nr:unnamed protein product [Haemonchus placei]